MKQAKPKKFSPYFYNRVTYAGIFLALLVFLVECFLFTLDFLAHGDLYLGLLTYVAIPPFLILGLALIPIGAIWKRRRVEKGLAVLDPKILRIDPSIPSHRNALIVFISGTFILIVMSLVGAYKGFHYMESVEFCGVLCHQVMNPEYTTYNHSPHARVKCVDCHVGSGADWYAYSKISGTRRLFKISTGTYDPPIKTPVHDLRPAKDTCQQCHSPEKHFSTTDFHRSYFLSGEDNARWDIRMLMKVGAGENKNHGVHAHMNVDKDVYYAAEDEERQKITWVKSVGKDGIETVYVAPGSKYEKEAPPPEKIRLMDCIDCHNRPTHQFLAPYRVVNDSLADGSVDPTLPSIKEKAMELLSADYPTQKEGVEAIRKEVLEYYRTEHPEVAASKSAEVEKSAEKLAKIYSENQFPEMKVRWDTHPDNIGHLVAPGCFRCHGGEHASVEGKVITRDCKACHTLVEQGPAGAVEKNIEGLEFRHPDGGEEWKDMNCSDCHTGGV